MHVYVSPVGRVVWQILPILNMAVSTDTSLVSVCSGCACNYWDFIVNFDSKDNVGIDFLLSHGVFYPRQSSVIIANCRAG